MKNYSDNSNKKRKKRNKKPKKFTTSTQPLSRQKKGDCVGRAGKLKGTKISLIVNEAGLPEAIHIEKGSRHDRHAFGSVMAEIPTNSYIVADKGYDCKRLRRQLRHKGLTPVIPKRQFKNKPKVRTPKPKIYKGRWTIERTFSWLEGFRKLILRFERKLEHWQALWELGCAMLHLKKLTV